MSQRGWCNPKLLISVRSAAEAESALAGGAALIDVKEPERGSLGRASDATIAEVIACVAGRAAVSAALGELLDAGSVPYPDARLAFMKWGLAGAAMAGDWQLRLHQRA